MRPKHLVGLVAMVAVAIAAPAARAETPAKGYEQFAGCPSKKENPVISTCLRTVVTGGHFHMGNKEVPITNPITISGGADEFFGNFAATSKGGMPPVKQKVPGGVIGLTGLTFLLELLGSEALTLYAATELAGTPVFSGIETITLPIKVHLINAVLGNNCYVGSVANPITLHLGITNIPKISVDSEREILHIDGGVYTDNTFSAPGASGCVLTLFGFIPISINGLVNAQSGLPAASGTNNTEQVTNTEIVDVDNVYP